MNRPRIIINCAMSVDGKIALPNRKQLRISSDEDMGRVFRLRNQCDGILVGIGAVLSDDPKLTVKESYVEHPRHPVRIVLDTHARTPKDALVVNDAAPTLIFIGEGEGFSFNFPKNVEVIQSRTDRGGHIDLIFLLEELYRRGITSLLVEGGGSVIWSFLFQRLVDDLYVYIGSLIIGGVSAPTMADGSGVSIEADIIRLLLVDSQRIGDGVLLHYRLQ